MMLPSDKSCLNQRRLFSEYALVYQPASMVGAPATMQVLPEGPEPQKKVPPEAVNRSITSLETTSPPTIWMAWKRPEEVTPSRPG